MFVSDIRLFTKAEATNALTFNLVKDYHDTIALRIVNEKIRHADYVRDMQLQEDWLEFVNAQYGLFKFKLKTKSFVDKQNTQYKYPDGDIILQAWAPIASTETRLFVRPDRKPAFYNVKKYLLYKFTAVKLPKGKLSSDSTMYSSNYVSRFLDCFYVLIVSKNGHFLNPPTNPV